MQLASSAAPLDDQLLASSFGQATRKPTMTASFPSIGRFLALLCAIVGLAATNGFSMEMSAANKGKINVIAGATGYIGKSVVRESVRQGYDTIALVRDQSKVTSPQGKALFGEFFEGAKVVECDVTNPEQLLKVRLKTEKQYNDDSSLIMF